MKIKILNVAIIILLMISTSACIVTEKGPHLYDVKAETVEGKEFIHDNEVKYAVESHFAIMWADFSEGDGYFVIKVDGEYYKVKTEYAEKYGLEADYSLWRSYGWMPVSLLLLILLILLFAGVIGIASV